MLSQCICHVSASAANSHCNTLTALPVPLLLLPLRQVLPPGSISPEQMLEHDVPVDIIVTPTQVGEHVSPPLGS